MGEAENEAGHDPRQRQRNDDAAEGPEPRDAEAEGGLEEPARNAGEGRREGLNGEGKAVENRRDEEPGEGERQPGTGEALDETAERAPRTRRDEEVEAEDRRREGRAAGRRPPRRGTSSVASRTPPNRRRGGRRGEARASSPPRGAPRGRRPSSRGSRRRRDEPEPRENGPSLGTDQESPEAPRRPKPPSTPSGRRRPGASPGTRRSESRPTVPSPPSPGRGRARSPRGRRRRRPTRRTAPPARRSRRRRASPSTESKRPSDRSAASAARPYGAWRGFAIAIFFTAGSARAEAPASLDVDRRLPPDPDDEASDPVNEFRVRIGEARLHELRRVFRVGREKEIERRSVRDLREEVPGRAEGHLHLDVRAALPELREGGLEGEFQVRGRGDGDLDGGRRPRAEERRGDDGARARPRSVRSSPRGRSIPFFEYMGRRVPAAAPGRLPVWALLPIDSAARRRLRCLRAEGRLWKCVRLHTGGPTPAGGCHDSRNRDRPLRRLPDGARAPEGSAGLKEEVFTPSEIAYCEAKRYPARHFAARFAAKEALVQGARRRRAVAASFARWRSSGRTTRRHASSSTDSVRQAAGPPRREEASSSPSRTPTVSPRPASSFRGERHVRDGNARREEALQHRLVREGPCGTSNGRSPRRSWAGGAVTPSTSAGTSRTGSAASASRESPRSSGKARTAGSGPTASTTSASSRTRSPRGRAARPSSGRPGLPLPRPRAGALHRVRRPPEARGRRPAALLRLRGGVAPDPPPRRRDGRDRDAEEAPPEDPADPRARSPTFATSSSSTRTGCRSERARWPSTSTPSRASTGSRLSGHARDAVGPPLHLGNDRPAEGGAARPRLAPLAVPDDEVGPRPEGERRLLVQRRPGLGDRDVVRDHRPLVERHDAGRPRLGLRGRAAGTTSSRGAGSPSGTPRRRPSAF